MANWEITEGESYPMGACVKENGVNFTLFSSRAERVELCLFHGERETRLDLPGRSGHIWHGFVPGLGVGQRYGYRVYGNTDRQHGLYFNPRKLLIDPYSKLIDGSPRYGTAKEYAWFNFEDTRDNAMVAAKTVVVGPSHFDWEGDQHPNTPWAKTVIYETHVKGLTKELPGVKYAGTYRALTDPKVLDYLKSLGITAIEFLPVHQHLDESHLQARGKVNYWGYNTYSHFAVEPRYAANPEAAADEFKAAVKALHKAGIEVILDVVYNHTAEQGTDGPLLCQRGIDNPSWYWVNEEGYYMNWSGTGNTIHVRHRNITRWVMNSLRYWVKEFHIDGFRFDLATILGREPGFEGYGRFMQALYQDPVLTGRKLIAEPWDIGDFGYQLGAFPYPFAEWNGHYRDDIRSFWIQESGNLQVFAERVTGSAGLFKHDNRPPSSSINFISAHDGFTLRDMVSYNYKHNAANGENNRDGHNDNRSYNHGAEGPTFDENILLLREYTSKAMLATLILSHGTPMLLAGDEFGNSQHGNNNAYCQDNELSWLNWNATLTELRDYTQSLLTLRREMDFLSSHNKWWGDNIRWMKADGKSLSIEDWENRSSKALQILINNQWLFLVNSKRSKETFILPDSGNWQCRLAPSDAYKFNGNVFQVTHAGIWIMHCLNTINSQTGESNGYDNR